MATAMSARGAGFRWSGRNCAAAEKKRRAEFAQRVHRIGTIVGCWWLVACREFARPRTSVERLARSNLPSAKLDQTRLAERRRFGMSDVVRHLHYYFITSGQSVIRQRKSHNVASKLDGSAAATSAAFHVASYCKIITSVVPQLRLANHGAAFRAGCLTGRA
jgi:hypothetical protein